MGVLAISWEASGSDPSDCSNTYTHTSSGVWSTDCTWYSTSKPLSLSTCISLTWSLKLSIEMGFMRSTTATHNTHREGGRREGGEEGGKREGGGREEGGRREGGGREEKEGGRGEGGRVRVAFLYSNCFLSVIFCG